MVAGDRYKVKSTPITRRRACKALRREIRHRAACELMRRRRIYRRMREGLFAAGLAQLRADAEARLRYDLTMVPHPSDPYPVLTRAGALMPVSKG